MIRPGELRQRVTIQVGVPATDPRWGAGVEWQDVDTVWAGVIARTASERTDAKGQQSEITHDVVMRYRSDVDSKVRLAWDGRTLEVVGAVDPDGRRRELRIEAIERPQANA